MPLQTEIETAVTNILNQRAHAAQAHQQELERVATERVQREQADAARAAAALRESELAKLVALENERDSSRAQLMEAIEIYRTMPDKIAVLRGQFTTAMMRIAQQRAHLGLKG
ncbi:MAG: hypothetical protein ABSG08_01085 [Terriglobales bacterium]|jgi:uncharacterized protein (DUF3084 family)